MHERETIAQAAILHVWNRYFSFGLKRLFLSGFHGNSLTAHSDGV